MRPLKPRPGVRMFEILPVVLAALFYTLQILGLLFRHSKKVKTQIFEATGETEDNVLSTHWCLTW